ncbi:MAG: hypothetical protein FXF47_09140 [Candidatus Mcinerneyibacterium aminivorans]|uniref:Uncharacterized protein n=1 Tax=Candidatus Mcinerneyibacterium aminivorans TaxID=2703815 RepID=A0A5D0MBQ0_9BACT|nr:MAG: hypothetical protein FXF47_09140 [Candidatus Mcinerneyibacterium aminivorans]
MKRQYPMILTFVFGLIGFILRFSPILNEKYLNDLLSWTMAIAAFAVVIAVISLVKHHAEKIRRKHKDMIYSFVTFIGLIVMALVGILGHYMPGSIWKSIFDNLYKYVRTPLDATMFSLLAFYISSAAYRAFRARTWHATALLISGFIVMIGRVAFGPLMIFADITNWIMLIPTTAVMRAIMIGVGLGITATSIKIILGIETSYLGGGEK